MFGKALYNVYFSKHSVQYIIPLTSLVHTNVKIPQVFFTNKEADFGRKSRKILKYRLLEFSPQPHWKDAQMGPGYDNLVSSYQACTAWCLLHCAKKKKKEKKKKKKSSGTKISSRLLEFMIPDLLPTCTQHAGSCPASLSNTGSCGDYCTSALCYSMMSDE